MHGKRLYIPHWIVFEGINGSGKTTQLKRAADFLRQRELTVVETLEPGGTDEGSSLRLQLLDANGHLSPEMRTELFLEDRTIHLRELVAPILLTKGIILQDRCGLSTVVFQSNDYTTAIERKCAPTMLRFRNSFAHIRGLGEQVFPGLLMLFDCPIETAIRRMRKARKNDFYDIKSMEYHGRIRQTYLTEAQELGEYSERTAIIQAGGSKDEVWDSVERELVFQLRL